MPPALKTETGETLPPDLAMLVLEAHFCYGSAPGRAHRSASEIAGRRTAQAD